MRSNFDDVGDFHERFGLDNVTWHDPGERDVPVDLMAFRIKFLTEELVELQDAWVANSRVDMFDALLDLVYVAMGTAHLMGLPWQAGWDEVQRANMTKVRAASDGTDSKRSSGWDVIKPPGWTPPDLESVLTPYLCPACKRNLATVDVREVRAVMGALPRVDLHCACGRYLGSRAV